MIQMARLRNEEMPNAEVDLHEIFSTSRPENYYLNGRNKGISEVLINFFAYCCILKIVFRWGLFKSRYAQWRLWLFIKEMVHFSRFKLPDHFLSYFALWFIDYGQYNWAFSKRLSTVSVSEVDRKWSGTR